MKLVDVSAFLGHWPFRAVSRTASEMKADLQGVGIQRAWIASLDAFFHPDPTAANDALAQAAGGDAFFCPLAVINPAVYGWEKQIEHARKNAFRGWKISPNYHGYDVSGDLAASIATLAAQASLPLCIQMRLQDERGHHPLMKVPGVPAQAIVELAKKVPQAKIVACAPYMSELKILAQAPNIWAELSFAESGQSLNDALTHLPANRLLFGSHAPLHYPAAEAAKLSGGLDIPEEVLAQIAHGNAQDLIPR